MIDLIRLVFSIFVLVLIIPQTPTENALLRIFNESRFFTNYGEAKWFLNFLTWSCIFIFLLISFFSAVK